MKFYPNASGPHTTFEFGPDGRVSKYQEWIPSANCRNPNPFTPGKRFRGGGKPHNGVKPPFIIRPDRTARPARVNELPRGY